MEKVKVKAYGIIHFTKKQYIITQLLGFSFLFVLLLLSSFLNLDKATLGNAKIFLIIIIILECIETFFMFRKFKQKESVR